MTIDYSNETLFERAERGAALLDRDVPDWYVRIDTNDLNLKSCYSCIFGQLYDGYYDEGERTFFGFDHDTAGEDAAAHGFTLGDYDDLDKDDENWADLTEAWIQIIEARRASSGIN